MKPAFLIIEDDPLMRKSLENICNKNAYRSFAAANAKDGIGFFENNNIDLVLLDMRLPDANGMDVLSQILKIDEEAAVIMMTAFPDVKSAVETIKNGAFDYVTKPFEVEELRQTINKALEIRSLKDEVLRLQRERSKHQFPEILGTSPEIKEVKALIAKVGEAANTPVLIIGASGSGKELTANAVLLQVPHNAKLVCLSWPPAVRFFWMKFLKCSQTCNQNYCVFLKDILLSDLAAQRTSMSMLGSSQLQTKISKSW